ncbi:MAG: 30S ribosomal protein S18 [Spirochaetes bacterium]|nr:30S ribosomal protein S18 [Spirochaetota bacterium]
MSDIIDNEAKEAETTDTAGAASGTDAAPTAGESAPKEAGESAPKEAGVSAPKEAVERTDAPRERSDHRPTRGTDSREREGGGGYSPRPPRFKRKVCLFCQDRSIKVDYKRPDILERFITDRGKILPRRVTGTCSKHQRHVAREIKRARIIALLPFIEQ